VTAARLCVVDPIPLALAHYRLELADLLVALDIDPEDVASPSIEASAAGPSMAGRAARTLWWRFRNGRSRGATLVLFPAFGLVDPITWWPRRGAVWLVIHDPAPVARQLGTGGLAARLGRLAVGPRLRIVVHSEPAAELLRKQGWPVELLPHPIRRLDSQAVAGSRPDGGPVAVLGQWKPARSLEPLQQLSSVAEWDGRRQVVGRGWPAVPGWAVDNRFVDEAELDSRIAAAACVLLPYHRYFQSGIAVRCLEAGTPVVGQRHPFLVDLLGAGWPGLVEDDDWVAATRRAVAVPAAEVLARRDDYWERCVAAWETSSLVSSLRG
jgi:hypothetical protein